MKTKRKPRSAGVVSAPEVAQPSLALLAEVRDLVLEARQQTARAVNAGLTLLYWQVGDRIRREILRERRAEYGSEILQTLSAKLEAEFGRGFSQRNLANMVRFAEAFPDRQIVSTLLTELSWSHFLPLIYLKDPLQRNFYAEMSRVERWSTRTLQERIQSMLYERTALSKKPEQLIDKELKALREEDRQTTARRMFSGSPAVGATVQLDGMGEFIVTGILPDPPHRSHIRFDFLVSYATIHTMSEEELAGIGIDGFDQIWRGLTYVLLAENGSREILDQALAVQTAAYSARSEKLHYLFQSQPLATVMPSRDLANEIGTGTPHIVLYFLMAVGLIIMLSACFNYMNLSLARSVKRSREIGIRKVVGARGDDVARQFLTEAVLISLLAFVLGCRQESLC